MTLKTAMITVFLAIIFAGGGMTGYIILSKDKRNVDLSQKEPIDPPLSSFATNKNNDNDQDLSVKSAQSDNSSNTLPGPTEFSVYEQYKNAGSTQYIDITTGSGDEAVTGATVHVVYSGYLTDGTLFDQTNKNELGQLVAFSFTLGGGEVIQGWEQGIKGMKPGGKRRLIIPSQFGYGEQGAGNGKIPPNSMLIFDVELVKVDAAG